MMIDFSRDPLPDRLFEVRLGYTVVRVRGDDAGQARQEARRQLCRQMPRLWDLIRLAEDHRFEVREVA